MDEELVRIGRNLAAKRKEKKVRQVQLAKLIGVERTTYNRYERGENPMKIHHLHMICSYLGCSADYVLGLEIEKKTQLTEFEQDWLSLVKNRPHWQLNILYFVAKGWLKEAPEMLSENQRANARYSLSKDELPDLSQIFFPSR